MIANAQRLDVIYEILGGEDRGTLFVEKKDENFSLSDYLENR